jgi:DNA-binding HxlR family transcriptional regulator
MSSESGQPPAAPADVFSERCPSRTALDLVAHTWAVLVASSLADGPKRHSRLFAQIGGISKKALTQTLRELERSGLVERRVYSERTRVVPFRQLTTPLHRWCTCDELPSPIRKAAWGRRRRW